MRRRQPRAPQQAVVEVVRKIDSITGYTTLWTLRLACGHTRYVRLRDRDDGAEPKTSACANGCAVPEEVK